MIESTPRYLTSVRIQNLRCFDDVTLSLTDANGKWHRWTVVLGENGRGKTTLLQAMVIERYWHGSATPHPLFLRRALKIADCAGVIELTHTDNEPQVVTRDELGTTFHFHADSISNTLPLFAYGATRRSSISSLAAAPDNGDPVASLMDPEARLINAEEWLLRLDYAAKASNDGERAQARLDAVSELLVDLLPDVSAIDILPPDDDDGGRVLFHTPFGAVGLMDLGLGYQAMIAWMVDLAARLHRQYKDCPRPTDEPCIVLVDEIDLHLHPTWQRHLQSHLLSQFPAAQFIVTAHSPLMVQSALTQNLAVLSIDGDSVRIDNDPRVVQGWRVDQLLTSELFQLSSSRPPETSALLDERTKLVGQGALDAAGERRLATIDKALSTLPTADSVQEQDDLDALKVLATRLLHRLESP